MKHPVLPSQLYALSLLLEFTDSEIQRQRKIAVKRWRSRIKNGLALGRIGGTTPPNITKGDRSREV
jgi:hypothetical protein